MRRLPIWEGVSSFPADKYCMRINEDFLDNIEDDVLDTKSQTDSELSSSDGKSLAIRFQPRFQIKNTNKPEEWYFQKVAQFLRLFYGCLDNCPYISELNRSYEIYAGYLSDENESWASRSQEGVTILWPSKSTFVYEMSVATMKFDFSIEANTEGIIRVRRLCLSLWNIFEQTIKKTFGSYGKTTSIMKNAGEGEDDSYRSKSFYILNSGDLYMLKNILNPDNERKAVELYRAFHPDMMPKPIKQMLADLRNIQDSGSRVKEEVTAILVNNICISDIKDVQIKDRKAYVNLNKKVFKIWSLEYILKRIIKTPTPIPFVIVAEEINIQLSNCLDSDPMQIPKKFIQLQKFISTYMDGVKTVTFNIKANEYLYKLFNGKILDLTKLFPDYETKFRVTDKVYTEWNGRHWYQGCTLKEKDTPFKVTFKSS